MKRYSLLWIVPFFFLHWTLSANAETAGEVSGWCREYDNVDAASGARFTQPDSRTNHYCWGAFAAVQYALCPEVDMDGMVRQLHEALMWIWRELPRMGYTPRRTVLIGHSAGAHLAAMLALTDWTKLGLPAESIAGACGVSGLYELQPLRLTSFNRALGMDEAAATRRDVSVGRTGARAQASSLSRLREVRTGGSRCSDDDGSGCGQQ